MKLFRLSYAATSLTFASCV